MLIAIAKSKLRTVTITANQAPQKKQISKKKRQRIGWHTAGKIYPNLVIQKSH